MDSNAVVVVRFDPSLRNVHVEIEADDVSESKKKKLVQKLGKYLPADPELDRDVFLKNCVASADKQVVQSDLIETYQDRDGDTFEIRLSRLGKNSDDARRFHAAVETFSIFFIDGASNIDSEDSRWELLTIWQKSPCTKLVGYMTLYTFTNPTRLQSPDSIRICQVIILPTFQRRGHGRRLFRATHELARKRNCYQVTVEDPAPGFARLRDREDMSRICDLNILVLSDENASYEDICKPLSKEQLNDAVQKTRTTKEQVVRCFEALILARLDDENEQSRDVMSYTYRPLRIMIKRRLFDTVETRDSEERKRVLQEMFMKLVEEYRAMRPTKTSKKRVLDKGSAVSNAKRVCVREDSLLTIGITTKQN